MARVPTPSKRGVAGDHGQADAGEREDQAEQGAEVLEQHHRQLGALGAADERDPALVPLHVGRASRTAVRSEKVSSTIATPEDAERARRARSMSCGWRSLSTPS